MKPELWVAFGDAHAPWYHRPTLRCLLEFIAANPVRGIVDMGDSIDNDCISHHTKGKPGLRNRSQYKMDTRVFFDDIVEPLEAALAASRKLHKTPPVTRIRLTGNHCDWEREYYQENPEIEGMLDRFERLRTQYGYTVIPFGEIFTYGALSYTHGENIAGGENHSKRALEIFCRNILYAHFHTVQMRVKVLASDFEHKFLACSMPILGQINPRYMENKPSAWINGWAVIEYHGAEKSFNLYPIIVTKGRAAYGGRVYGA